MAEVFSATNGGVALVAATAKTVIEISSGTATGRVVAAEVSFDASSPTAAIKVELVRYTTTGTGTAYTLLRFNGEGQNRAAVMTAKINNTVEPGTPTVVSTFYVPNTSGQLIQYPLGREFYIPSSAFMGLRVTAPTGTPNCAANLYIEE